MSTVSFFRTYRIVVLAVAIAVVVLVGLSILSRGTQTPPGPEPTTFFECAQHNKVEEGFPRTCRSSFFSKVFVEYVENGPQYVDIIRVDNLPPAVFLHDSPVVVRGFARREWFKDGTFSVELVSERGVVIGKGTASAEDAPPTMESLRFTATIDFDAPKSSGPGALVLHKGDDNKEGYIFPVSF